MRSLGWQKGKYGNVSYIEADGQSKHWKSNVRLFPNEELALVLLAYTDRSREADRWLRIVEAQFISKFVAPEPCVKPAWIGTDGRCFIDKDHPLLNGTQQPAVLLLMMKYLIQMFIVGHAGILKTSFTG